jgi:hypothetical protein
MFKFTIDSSGNLVIINLINTLKLFFLFIIVLFSHFHSILFHLISYTKIMFLSSYANVIELLSFKVNKLR